MHVSDSTPYDEVAYPSAVYAQTHPDRLATLATLFGMTPADVKHSRVLELGCGDGGNLIAMAYGLPQSEFVGIDLSQRAIQSGQNTANAAGLKNIALHHLDLLDVPSDFGTFDFILAHGLYSWVPTAARDKILALCAEKLTPQGVAYISYNAYPGNHLRDLARGMMRYHASHFAQPEQQILQARSLLQFLSESKEEPDPYTQILKREMERVLKYTDAAFFHDDLSPENHPVYFHEFAAHAAQHGLQYLAEADILDMREETYPPQTAAVLRELDGKDVVVREQYRDFLKCRAFRQTLLCRSSVSIDRSFDPRRVRTLYVAAEVRPASIQPDTASDSPELFLGPKGAEIETARPLLKTAFFTLGTLWPKCFSFAELLTQTRARLGHDTGAAQTSEEADAQELSQALLQAHSAGFIELHAHAPRFTTEVSERPTASLLARLQFDNGYTAATLRHTGLRIDDPVGRRLVTLLDGTRDRAALVRALSEHLKAKSATVSSEKETDQADGLHRLDAELDAKLAGLARAAILIA